MQCQLSEHRTGDHYGFLNDAESATASWLRWSSTGTELVVLADCEMTSAGAPVDSCCLFEAHGGRHTWDEDRYE
ncbi:hypothetical protein [Streptomyces sp. DT195]|uniref:hypothetical protein n=1 Tax=Streptomyces sp. DT195 TaxID=3393419 RepID=UPI003CF2ACE7